MTYDCPMSTSLSTEQKCFIKYGFFCIVHLATEYYGSDSLCHTFSLIKLDTPPRDFFLKPFTFCVMFCMVLSFQLTLAPVNFPFSSSIAAFTSSLYQLALHQPCPLSRLKLTVHVVKCSHSTSSYHPSFPIQALPLVSFN